MLVAWGAIPGSSGIFSRMDESHRVTVFGEGHDDWQVSHSPERKQSSWGDLSGAGRRGRDGWAVRSGGLEGADHWKMAVDTLVGCVTLGNSITAPSLSSFFCKGA